MHSASLHSAGGCSHWSSPASDYFVLEKDLSVQEVCCVLRFLLKLQKWEWSLVQRSPHDAELWEESSGPAAVSSDKSTAGCQGHLWAQLLLVAGVWQSVCLVLTGFPLFWVLVIYCPCFTGVSAAFAVKLFKSWINEKDINAVAVSLRKVNMDNRLMVSIAAATDSLLKAAR